MRGTFVLLVTVGAAGAARADVKGSARSVGEALVYVLPATAAVMTTAVNGVSVAYDEPTSRFWRVSGYVAGGAELVLGAGLLAFRNESTGRVVLGAIPVALGISSLATAFFAPADVTFTATPTAGGGVVGISGRF